MKDTNECNTSAFYLDLPPSIGRKGQLRTSLYDKHSRIFARIWCFISQLIRFVRACSTFVCFILRTLQLSNKLLEQGYVKERLKSSLRELYSRYRDLIKQYEVVLSGIFQRHSGGWPYTVTPYIDKKLRQYWTMLIILTILPNLTSYLIVWCFHWAIVTGSACQQRTSYISEHLFLSNFRTCICSNVETNSSLICLVSELFTPSIDQTLHQFANLLPNWT